ncbi:GntR family transcriptional regulator [Rhodococcus triatomae]|uniref:DNA-binding transcriptional regulator, GntR family n=1 Tax=Rhodococcus triatomae TaxID=300028 RepID=A0A1G8S280_9NOCA|nr:GntR family transcriptional regulator [Rhodococcus triatomae]QNG17343.1 GntR family transcriptional regulator [Rhodococcus triatomae]QNG22990.1 GntR family transcriptional regulator [Rhodococcus triatomae]SDJ23232.1 DNA-binding transcriptional regulator, GntR family [Rhodococcus triatomae]
MLHSSSGSPAPSAAEQVYQDVKELILSGGLPGGELISEGEVANRTGCSRTPVREAFLRLEAEGWMRLYPKRGALIVPVADGEAEHIVDARQLLETHSVRYLAEHAAERAAVVHALDDNLDRQLGIVRDGDVVAFSAADADFHRLIVRAGDNPLLDSFYGGLRERQRRMTARSLARDPEQLPAIVDDHVRLRDLVEAADPDGYDAALLEHMLSVHALNPRSANRRGPRT